MRKAISNVLIIAVFCLGIWQLFGVLVHLTENLQNDKSGLLQQRSQSVSYRWCRDGQTSKDGCVDGSGSGG